MIFNIIDRRKRPYRWLVITAILEPTEQDNSVKDSDQCQRQIGTGIGYDDLPETTLHNAVRWAEARPYGVTLYLYDLGDGIKEAVGIKRRVA